jgi:hypothetical protein
MVRADEQHDARERALDALAIARRDGVSLSEASRRVRSTRETVLKYAGAGFDRRGRRYVPRPFDRIRREVVVLEPSGPRYVRVSDSRTASALADQANAIQAYVRRGDETFLRRLKGRTVTIAGERYRLELTPAEIDRLAMGGELHYELYRR